MGRFHDLHENGAFHDLHENRAISIFTFDKIFDIAAGICTIRGLKMTTKKKLCEIKGISDAKVDKVRPKISGKKHLISSEASLRSGLTSEFFYPLDPVF